MPVLHVRGEGRATRVSGRWRRVLELAGGCRVIRIVNGPSYFASRPERVEVAVEVLEVMAVPSQVAVVAALSRLRPIEPPLEKASPRELLRLICSGAELKFEADREQWEAVKNAAFTGWRMKPRDAVAILSGHGP